MKIGIMSDTHDDVHTLAKAKDVFLKEKVDAVLHAGDFVAPSTVAAMEGLKPIAVLGNNEAEWRLADAFRKIGGELHGRFVELEYDGLKIAMYHGTHKEMLNALIECKKYDVVIYGHTHQKDEQRVNNTLVINPGAANQYGDPSIAILDTTAKKVTFVDL